MKKACIIFLMIIAAALAADIITVKRDMTKEADIGKAVDSYTADCKAYHAEIKKVLLETLIPLIEKGDRLHKQSLAIRSGLENYLSESKVSSQQAEATFKIVDNYIDPNTVIEQGRLLTFLKAVTCMVTEGITNEAISDPNLLPVAAAD